MKKFLLDFKKFIMRGNVLDLAVAVVIGGAFGRIVQSMVKDLITPIISLALGKTGFDNYKFVITPENTDLGITENAINYGVFFQNVIDFVFIAFIVFLIVRMMNRINDLIYQKKIEEENRTKELAEIEKKERLAQEALKPKTEDILLEIKALLESMKS